MGAEVVIEDGYIKASTKGSLKAADIYLDPVSVTATENIMMAATLAEGTSVIRNAAREPEVVDLANCLIEMGAIIEGAGSDKIVIEGVKKLTGCEYNVMPDRVVVDKLLFATMVISPEIWPWRGGEEYVGPVAAISIEF